MKKKFKTLLCLLLTLAMALSLAACGGEGSNEKTPDKEDGENKAEFVYVPQFKKLQSDGKEYIRFLSADENKIYCSVEKVVGEDIPEGAVKEFEDQFAVYEQFLYTMDENGSMTELSEFSHPANQDAGDRRNYNTRNNIVTVFPIADGKLLNIESISTSWFEGADDVEYGSDEYWENQMYEEKYFARFLNEDGSEISSFPINVPENNYLGERSVAVDKDGNLVIATETGIQCLNDKGELIYEFPVMDMYIERLLGLSDGRIFAFYWAEKGPAVAEVDSAGKKLGETFILPEYTNEIYPGTGYDFCYTSGINFYGINLNEEPVKLFSWMDADINSDSIRNFVIKSDGSIVALSSEWDEKTDKNNFELITLTKQPYDSVPHKEELSLAVMWMDYDFKDTVIKYNRSNDKYRIVIKDYSEYNTEEDYEAGMTKLLTEIMSGEMPDMLSLSGLPYTQLTAKGIIEDIYPFIDADPELSRDDFQQNFFKALEVDGKLAQICPSFSILTAIGSGKIVGTEPGWNYKQFNEALLKMPEGCKPFGPYVAREDILRMSLSMDMELYADWSTGECHFDTPEFAELLNFAAQFPAEINFEEIADSGMGESDAFASGMQMLSSSGIGSFDDLQYNDVYFGGESTYIGFPSASGNGSAFQAGNGYAITRNCSNKEAAWDFLRTLLTEDYQMKLWYGLPTNQHAFDAKLKEAMTPEYQKDMDGNFILDENGEKIPVSHGGFGMADGTVYEMYSVSEAQADKFMQLLNSTEKLMENGSKLIDIVISDAAPFFEGQKSAEEVSKLIQSKVNIYINEQR